VGPLFREPSHQQRERGLDVISRSAYQRVVTRLSRRGSLQNTFGKIGLRRRGAMFKRHAGHNLFQGSTHDLDEFRVELLHGFGTPFCEETQTRLGPSPKPINPTILIGSMC
jgi:hypothetical protein